MPHRRLVPLLVLLVLFAVLLPGCILVTEPLSDPDKAEPDKRLEGKWQRVDDDRHYEIDCPVVKGNPKGLMRLYDGRADDPESALWFFTTKIGKDTYMTIYLEPGETSEYADFGEEGAFAKWNKGDDRGYDIISYVLDGDKLTVDAGDLQSLQKLMDAEKFERKDYFKTPPGWLAKYLEKSGPQTLYGGLFVCEWRRSKK
jgi:hypothetical protein